ncbi:MAG: hypothetical protein ACTH2Q_17465 [Propionibacteriaceae bacterium]
MKIAKRLTQSLLGILVLSLMGTLVASAFSWGTLSVAQAGAVQGQGKGSLAWVGLNKVELKSSLRDYRSGHGRTYADARASKSGNSHKLQSGRRADGGKSFAAMAVKSKLISGSSAGFKGQVRVCQDIKLSPDPCSGWVVGNF